MKKGTLLLMAFVVVGSGGAYWKSTLPATVKVVRAIEGPAETSIVVSGTVEAETRAKVVSELVNRRVVRVDADLGQTVQAGDVLLELNSDQERINVAKALAQVSVAEANLRKAIVSARGASRNQTIAQANLDDPIELSRAKLTTEANLRVSEERLSQAKIKRRRILAGARPEDVISAEADYDSALATLNLRETELARVRKLVDEGALAGSRLDQAVAAQKSAAAAVTAAKQKVSASRMPRKEDEEESNATVREAEASRQSALREYNAARQNLERKRNPAATLNSAVTDTETARSLVGAAQAEVEMAQATLRQATRDLNQTIIRSPISGVIAGRDIQVGETVEASRTLFQVISLRKLRARLDVDEKYAVKLQEGMVADVASDANPNLKLRATIAEISRQSNRDKGTVEVRLQFGDSEAHLLPEQTISATIVTMRMQKVTLLPANAVIREGEQEFVAVLTDQIVKRRAIKTILLDGEKVWVKEGLKVGEQVLADPRAANEGTRAIAEPAR